MILLNFFPEILITGLLLVSLMLMAFGLLTRGLLPAAVSVGSLLGLFYFMMRPDLSHFSGTQAMILSDSLSYFLRLIALLALGVFSMSYYFHRDLSLKEKQRATLFVQFLALFVCALSLSQNLPLFLGSSLGIYFCAANLILVESRSDQHWILVFRQKAVWICTWMVLVSLLFILSAHAFRTLHFGEWVTAVSKESVPDWVMVALIPLVVMVGLLPLGSSRYVGKAPVGLGILSFGTLLILQSFWFRAGIPLLNAYSGIPKETSRLILGLMIGAMSLRSVYDSIRTREHHAWLSSVYSVFIGITLFSILLPSEQSVSAFYILALGTLFTYGLISHAFLDTDYRNKALILIALIAIPGAPPLVMGDRYYQMIYDLLASSNGVAATLVGTIWLALFLASIQIIGKILLIRISKEVQRAPTAGEGFFLTLYLIGVIALSAFRPQILAVLNAHPPLNLW